MKILTPLKHRNFRILFFGQAVSDQGDWLSFIALVTIIAYRMNAGPGALAALTMAMIVPVIAIAPLAGVLVDRWRYRTVMITADVVRAGLVFSMVFISNLYLLLVFVFLTGAVTTFFSPARQAAIRYTLDKEDLLQANALSQLSVQAAKITGPAIGGVLVALFSPQAAFVLDSVSYLLSAIILSFLPNLEKVKSSEDTEEDGEETKTSFWQELKAGMIYIFRRRNLAIAVISTTMAMFIIFTFDALGALALKQLGIGEDVLGLAVGAIGAGTALGAFLIGQWGQRFQPLTIIAQGNLLGGLCVAFLGLAILLNFNGLSLAMLPLWLIIGLTGAAMFVPYGYVIQSETPPEMIGRVSATAGSIQTTFQLLAPPLGAVLAEVVGIGAVFGVAGIALALVGVFILVVGGRGLKTSAMGVNSRVEVESPGVEAESLR